MRFEEWDHRIAPRLRKMDSACHWLIADAGDLQACAETLPARPCWETLARENLNKAEVALRTALAVILATQDRYDNLPVIVDSNMIEPDDEQLRYETETNSHAAR